MKMIPLLQFAAVLHLGLLCAGALMPGVVRLTAHLGSLPPFIRRLFWVYYGFIASLLVGFGALTFLFAPAMAAGEPAASGLCWLLALFWVVRMAVAIFVFDLRPYLTSWLRRVGHQAT